MSKHTPGPIPHVTLTRDASILATELRGESHESLACLAANLTCERDALLAALRIAYARLDSLGANERPALHDEMNQIEAAIAKVQS
jgi:hypothetical protein